jgi:hypothetical protein
MPWLFELSVLCALSALMLLPLSRMIWQPRLPGPPRARRSRQTAGHLGRLGLSAPGAAGDRRDLGA